MWITKKISFDENSQPSKNEIWYRGGGKFYEYAGDKWVLAYDLAGTPSQTELNAIAEKIEEATGETLEDKSIAGILDSLSTQVSTTKPLIIEVEDLTNLKSNEKTQIFDYVEQGLGYNLILRCSGSLPEGEREVTDAKIIYASYNTVFQMYSVSYIVANTIYNIQN